MFEGIHRSIKDFQKFLTDENVRLDILISVYSEIVEMADAYASFLASAKAAFQDLKEACEGCEGLPEDLDAIKEYAEEACERGLEL